MKYSKLWMTLAAVASTGGLFFLGVAATFGYNYFAEPKNPLRHEALQGVALALFMAAPFWLVASATLWPVKAMVSTPWYILVNGITFIILLLVLMAYVYPLIMMTLAR